MPSFQKYIAMGHLTRDVEVQTAASGTVWARFSIAVDTGYGEKKSTLFVNCKCFGKRAEAMAKFTLQKGKLLIVEGGWRCDKVEKDGQEKTYWWVNVDDWQFGEGAKGGGRSKGSSNSGKQESLADWDTASAPRGNAQPQIDEDSIPF